MLSLITIAHGRRRQLQALLAAAAETTDRPHEVVVVDMGGGRWTAPADLSVEVVDLPVPDGADLPLAAARNRGAEAATGPALLFLDVDCVPGVDLVGEMNAALQRRNGLVMANVQYLPEGFVDHRDEGRRWEAGSPHPAQENLDRDVPPELFWSTAFGVHRDDFAELGGFCEAYVGYGGEDTDLGMTAAAAGVPISRWRTALAYHQWHPSPEPPLQHVASIVRNARVFHDRWGRWPMTGWLEQFAELGLVDWRPGGDAIHLVRPSLTPAGAG